MNLFLARAILKMSKSLLASTASKKGLTSVQLRNKALNFIKKGRTPKTMGEQSRAIARRVGKR